MAYFLYHSAYWLTACLFIGYWVKERKIEILNIIVCTKVELHAKWPKFLCNFARPVAYFYPFQACNIILANAGFEFEYIISSYETIPFSISHKFFL